MNELKIAQNDQEIRLHEMGGFGFIAIWTDNVEIEDILNSMRPGAIVRCYEKPEDCIKFFPPDDAPLGVVAGWISEDDQ